MAEQEQCEGVTARGKRCRIMGRRLCDIHSGAKAARRVRYGLDRSELEGPSPDGDDEPTERP